MSKGGAGKVYFVLYLAVVLELLIIIVERDEAEEHLHKKTKEAMRIVESILSQLQSGAGTEGINTRPQDEITIPPPGVNIKDVLGSDIKSSREYIIEVGVTDVSTSMKKREFETEKEYVTRIKKLVELANVEQIQYQVFFSKDQNPVNAPPFPSEEYLLEQRMDLSSLEPGASVSGDVPDVSWEFLGLQELNIDKDATFNNINLSDVNIMQISPVYPDAIKKKVGPVFNPKDVPEDSSFYYSGDETYKNMSTTSEILKRSFVVNFQPPSQAGWYKLRFASKTNRILGVKAGQKAEDISDDATVNIGTVQLKVYDLKKVKKELTSRLDKYELPTLEELSENGDILAFDKKLAESKLKAASEEKAEEVIGNINLYGYIVKLLAPGMSTNFDQNRGAIEFNIRVVTPKPNVAQPIATTPDYVPTFDKVAAVFECQISPYQPGQNTIEGVVMDAGGNRVASINFVALDEIAGLNFAKPVANEMRMYRASVDKVLPVGKYEYSVTHRLSGRASTPTTNVLEVFKSSLTEQSENTVKSNVPLYAYYGYPLSFSAEPSSGGKIKPNEFRIYVTTDNDNQRAPIQGLAVTSQNGITFTPESKQLNVRIVWNQPYTNNEVELFALSTKIKQEEPIIRTNQVRYSFSGTSAKFKVLATGISVGKPLTGIEGRDATINLSIQGQPEKLDGLTNYDFSTEAILEGDAESGYTLEFEMQGKLEPGQSKIRGTVSIPIVGSAVNPVNGVRSDVSRSVLSIPIEYEPDRGGPRRQGR
ncbi:MAG: hypothetical protein KIT33_10510 [Candidatus Kapabacteria bacterium]|nr:hypothetical protein [Ignavibacteriota bacterium]MCW5885391.1 hypothetical protein [Candidatus Kapabacteria bacterium]